MSASERMKRRWREDRDVMLAVLAKANAQASKRNHTRWTKDRERMTDIVTRNARKGSAALLGTHYSAERSRRASDGQFGKVQGGQCAKSPDHIFAAQYVLCDPQGYIHRGRNIIDFVRENAELFDPRDLEWRRGHCRASKGLSKLRPGLTETRSTWKGWSWA